MVSSPPELEIMAKKKKKAPQLSKRQRRKMRTQQILMAAIGILIVLSFIISLIA
jgi:hypothetical protein